MTGQRDITQNILSNSSKLHDVLARLNRGIDGVVFIVDDVGAMVGMFTDGDSRRALLNGGQMEDPVTSHMNRNYVHGKAGASRQENLSLLDGKVRHLPVLDELGRPVDMITWSELWRLPVMEPSLGGNELKYVSDCISSGWISSQGTYVRKFEEAFADYHGVPHAISVCNGTAALHLALVALGIGPGDEVIVPNLTFAASANVVIHCGAVPVLADVTPDTWTLDAGHVERLITTKTKAIMPVHLYGHPADMEPINKLAQKHGLLVVEDNAEALGAEYRGAKTGTLGDAGCFSFFANKVITTGEGGMITCRDSELARRIQVLRDHGMEKNRRYWHTVPGYNYRLTNLQAAIGLAQMEQLHRFLSRRDEVVALYDEGLKSVPGITLPPRAPWARNIHWLYSILVNEAVSGISRDALSTRLEGHGIETRPFFYPLHIQPPYQSQAREDYPISVDLSARGLSLPTANDIRNEDVERVCWAISDIVKTALALKGGVRGG
jgi:perosamine synthetase